MKRSRFPLTILSLLFGCAYLWAQSGNQAPLYKIQKDRVEKDGKSEDRIYTVRRPDAQGKSTLFVTVQFQITGANGELADDVRPDEIVIKEDGRKVTSVDIQPPTANEPLTALLAIDISGSMAEQAKLTDSNTDKMTEAKRAAKLFLDKLNSKSECGLILFDDKIQLRRPPTNNRGSIQAEIQRAQPGGGTAYIDAAAEAIKMLRNAEGRKAVILMTDGVDLNSQVALKDVIQMARREEVPIYTIGVGEPGMNTPVTTVMVLDKSGSMAEPAGDTDQISKMEALHRAGGRFIDIMRRGARTTLLPFSDEPENPEPFSDNKERLKEQLQQLTLRGETAIFDATHEALRLLSFRESTEKRAVVLMTDGRDNRSQRRARDVIQLATNLGIPLYVLGLGRQGNLDERTMKQMADKTGGAYYRADSEQMLSEIFERLSIQLHDEGIDETSLKQLAEETGGKYFLARDISRLRIIYEGLAQELQSTYRVTFPSLRQDDDGTSRDIDISIWRNGAQVSDVFRGGYNVRGVIVPEMDYKVYLAMLAALGGFLALPSILRRMAVKPSSSAVN